MNRPDPSADQTERTGISQWKAWWDGRTDPERFRYYTRGISEATTIAVAVAMAVSLREPWLIPAAVIVAVAAALALESRTELSTWITEEWRRRASHVGVTLLVTIAAGSAFIVHTSNDAVLAADAAAIGIFTLAASAMAVVTFMTYRWSVAVGLGILAGPAFQSTPSDMVSTAALAVSINCFMVAITLLALWSLRVVEDLERARSAESELKVAQERLRFARDLHDVVGRGFSAVAVKSELAATLSRAGEKDRATAEMEEINSLAVTSMEQMRALVRGYRDVSLASEVAGARSLLSAAGCQLHVEGEANQVPQEFHEVAAWVVREGTTNIVKHTSATRATLSLDHAGMILSNDDAIDAGPPRSGHTGLAERLDAVGATMTTSVNDGHHILQVRWENP